FRALKVKNDRRPFVLSEYGGYSCRIPGHVSSDGTYGYRTFATTEKFVAELEKLQQTICRLREKGLSGAIYTQLSDIEEETNGLYTWDRKVCKISDDYSEQLQINQES
ncbi:MAG: glycoside hydrolase family 2, partial [Clostridiales bacterium]|nr:glycoside hydrolase family 2 [Clostridiales bacterium]